MAKVQEAKEIPTVKVLDAADIPDKKAFPPRMLIMGMGTILGFCVGVFFVIGSTRWNAIDPGDPGKKFATKVWVDLKAHAPWIARNGVGVVDEDRRGMNEAGKQGGQGGQGEKKT